MRKPPRELNKFSALMIAESRSNIWPIILIQASRHSSLVASAAVHSKAMALLLLIHCLVLLPLFMRGIFRLFCCKVFIAISSFAIISQGKKELVVLLKLSS